MFLQSLVLPASLYLSHFDLHPLVARLPAHSNALLNGCERGVFRFCMFVLQVLNAFKIWTEIF